LLGGGFSSGAGRFYRARKGGNRRALTSGSNAPKGKTPYRRYRTIAKTERSLFEHEQETSKNKKYLNSLSQD